MALVSNTPPVEHYDSIDNYIDHDCYTQFVDPFGTAPWVRDGDHKHLEARDRGRAVREKQLSVLLPMVAAASGMEADLFVPSVAEVEKLPKFASHVGIGNWGCDTWRGALRDVRGVGALPILNQTIRDEEFPQKDKGQVAREVHQENLYVSRVFDRSGAPDHGRYCAPGQTE